MQELNMEKYTNQVFGWETKKEECPQCGRLEDRDVLNSLGVCIVCDTIAGDADNDRTWRDYADMEKPVE
uniref:Uncharacterized protein n=1 Tax=viral metagenome TaxID=1070528 RepID=A0A6M3LX15_9ZZZZ